MKMNAAGQAKEFARVIRIPVHSDAAPALGQEHPAAVAGATPPDENAWNITASALLLRFRRTAAVCAGEAKVAVGALHRGWRSALAALRDRGEAGCAAQERDASAAMPNAHSGAPTDERHTERSNVIPLFAGRAAGRPHADDKAAEALRCAMDRYDHLTGLPARQRMDEIFDALAFNAQYRGGLLHVIVVGLGEGGQPGHAPDTESRRKLLTGAARRLRKCAGPNNILGCDRGNFILLVPDDDRQDLLQLLLPRIFHCLRRPFSISGRMVQPVLRIGVASCPLDGMDLDSLIRKACNWN